MYHLLGTWSGTGPVPGSITGILPSSDKNMNLGTPAFSNEDSSDGLSFPVYLPHLYSMYTLTPGSSTAVQNSFPSN